MLRGVHWWQESDHVSQWRDGFQMENFGAMWTSPEGSFAVHEILYQVIGLPSAFLRVHLCKEAAVSSQILPVSSLLLFPFLSLFPNAHIVYFQNLYLNVNRKLKTSANLYSTYCRALFQSTWKDHRWREARVLNLDQITQWSLFFFCFCLYFFFWAKGCSFQLFQTKNNITTQEVITQPHEIGRKFKR